MRASIIGQHQHARSGLLGENSPDDENINIDTSFGLSPYKKKDRNKGGKGGEMKNKISTNRSAFTFATCFLRRPRSQFIAVSSSWSAAACFTAFLRTLAAFLAFGRDASALCLANTYHHRSLVMTIILSNPAAHLVDPVMMIMRVVVFHKMPRRCLRGLGIMPVAPPCLCPGTRAVLGMDGVQSS